MDSYSKKTMTVKKSSTHSIFQENTLKQFQNFTLKPNFVVVKLFSYVQWLLKCISFFLSYFGYICACWIVLFCIQRGRDHWLLKRPFLTMTFSSYHWQNFKHLNLEEAWYLFTEGKNIDYKIDLPIKWHLLATIGRFLHI